MKNSTLKALTLAIALAVSMSGCSWIGGMFSNGDRSSTEDKVAVEQVDVARGEAVSGAPLQMADAHGHYVEDGSGRTVTSGYGDCVHIGSSVDSGNHPKDCDKQGLKPATDAVASDEPRRAAMPAKPATTAKRTPLNPPAAGNGAPAIVQEPAPTAQLSVTDDMPTKAPSYEKISLQGDALFRFGKSNEASILPSARKKLDELAAQLAGYDKNSIESVVVVGHADRLGKPAPNQLLSERRANTVKNYFVKHGVDGVLIKATGKGTSQPVKQCKGKKKTPALIACLEPNRRVDIVIRGVKGG
ncbi:MAG: OmpA family protein [Burkholderiales bacterium]